MQRYERYQQVVALCEQEMKTNEIAKLVDPSSLHRKKLQSAVEQDFFTVMVRKEEEFFARFVRINGCTSGLPRQSATRKQVWE